MLGKYLVRRVGDTTTAYMITEVEAYHGLQDKASHAHRGQTPRNTPMYAGPGTIYVYFTYGIHWMLNIVCGKEGKPGAVLIRGVQQISSEKENPLHLEKVAQEKLPPPGDKGTLMPLQRRNTTPTPFGSTFPSHKLNGPAKLTKHLRVDKQLNGLMLGKKVGLWVEDRGVVVKKSQIHKTPRIGVGYAEDWAAKKWRFVLEQQ
jgi:DNA-3-methyladenine glycosylase